jgi:hypothetical protein
MRNLIGEHMSFDRRRFISGGLSAIVSGYLDKGPGEPQKSLSQFDILLSEIRENPQLANSFVANDEPVIASKTGPERAPIRAKKSNRAISSRGSDLILASEVTGESTYRQRYTGPVWPHGESGITIGIGYDLGESRADYFHEDWGAYLDSRTISILTPTCRITGQAAATALTGLERISIPWEVALSQYRNETLPRYIGETERALANTSSLSDDSLGALVSLVYNRGVTFNRQEPRYAEMNHVKNHMDSLEFRNVPVDLRCMERLWKKQPKFRGVVIRREAEAALFQYGLNAVRHG